MFGTSVLWRSTVGFTYLKVKSAKCLCLLPVVLVLVLVFLSCSCKQRSWSWSWSCYFGLGLIWSCLHDHWSNTLPWKHSLAQYRETVIVLW